MKTGPLAIELYPKTTAAIWKTVRVVRGLRREEIAGERLWRSLGELALVALHESSEDSLKRLAAPMQAGVEAALLDSGLDQAAQERFAVKFFEAFEASVLAEEAREAGR